MRRAEKLAAELANDVLYLAAGSLDGAQGAAELRAALRQSVLRRLFWAFGECACNADESEPIFTLRAQDAIAPEAVRAWAISTLSRGGADDKVMRALQDAALMAEWQRHNGCKVPD